MDDAARRADDRRRGESVTGVDFSRLLTRRKQASRYGWLRETPSTVLAQKLRDQDQGLAVWKGGQLSGGIARLNCL